MKMIKIDRNRSELCQAVCEKYQFHNNVFVGQQIRNTWKVLKCGAGEGCKRSVGPIV
jgi:hypothetical protein